MTKANANKKDNNVISGFKKSDNDTLIHECGWLITPITLLYVVTNIIYYPLFTWYALPSFHWSFKLMMMPGFALGLGDHIDEYRGYLINKKVVFAADPIGSIVEGKPMIIKPFVFAFVVFTALGTWPMLAYEWISIVQPSI